MRDQDQNEHKILSKLRPKVSLMNRPKTGKWGPPTIPKPPFWDSGQMIAWVPGRPASPTQKLEFINAYHFTQVRDYITLQIWSDIIRAPDTGEPGYAEILAVDVDGLLYDFGVPKNQSRVTLGGTNDTNMFFCDRNTKGLGVYDLTLTAPQIQECRDWWQCPVTHFGVDVTHDGVLVYHDWTHPLP